MAAVRADGPLVHVAGVLEHPVAEDARVPGLRSALYADEQVGVITVDDWANGLPDEILLRIFNNLLGAEKYAIFCDAQGHEDCSDPARCGMGWRTDTLAWVCGRWRNVLGRYKPAGDWHTLARLHHDQLRRISARRRRIRRLESADKMRRDLWAIEFKSLSEAVYGPINNGFMRCPHVQDPATSVGQTQAQERRWTKRFHRAAFRSQKRRLQHCLDDSACVINVSKEEHHLRDDWVEEKRLRDALYLRVAL